MVADEREQKIEFPYDIMNKIKALQDLKKHPVAEIVSWVEEALDYQYPMNHKKAFEIIVKMKWVNIRTEIIQTVKSQEFGKIRKLTDGMLGTDLLFNMEVIRNMNPVKDLGTLAVLSRDGIPLLTGLLLLNSEAKDPKIESYILYRYLNGQPKLSNGFMSKF
jgi:hypothetical protein